MKACILTAAALFLVSCGTAPPAANPAETAVSTESAVATETANSTESAVTTAMTMTSAVSTSVTQPAETVPPLTRSDFAFFSDPENYAGLDFYYQNRELLPMPEIQSPQTDAEYAEIAETLFQNMHRLYDRVLQIHPDSYDYSDMIWFTHNRSTNRFVRVADSHYQSAEELDAFLRTVFTENQLAALENSTLPPFHIDGRNGELDALECGDDLDIPYSSQKYRFIVYRGKLYRRENTHVSVPFYDEENARVPDMPIQISEQSENAFTALIPHYIANSEHKKIPQITQYRIVCDPTSGAWRIDSIKESRM